MFVDTIYKYINTVFINVLCLHDYNRNSKYVGFIISLHVYFDCVPFNNS